MVVDTKEKLEQEPCEDCVSRQLVIDILKDKWNMFSDANDAIQESIDTIEALPPVTPTQEPILNKIRAEIEQIIGEDSFDDYDYCSGLICARNIIDKYKESEEIT